MHVKDRQSLSRPTRILSHGAVVRLSELLTSSQKLHFGQKYSANSDPENSADKQNHEKKKKQPHTGLRKHLLTSLEKNKTQVVNSEACATSLAIPQQKTGCTHHTPL